MKTPFLGGFDQGLSTNYADDLMVNLFVERAMHGKEPGVLLGTPGLTLVGTAGVGPISSLMWAPAASLLLIGSESAPATPALYTATVTPNTGVLAAITNRGALVNDASQMIDNGTHALVITNQNGYDYNYATTALTHVLPGGSGLLPTSVAYQDGFGFIAQGAGGPAADSTKLYASANKDFTTWAAGNFGQADSDASRVVSLVSLVRELWVFKEESTEVWVNAGLQGFPFQRMQGVFIDRGCVSQRGACRVGNTVMWLGIGEDGAYAVFIANGYNAQRVSTPAVEYAISANAGGNVNGAIAYSYQDGGHVFFVLCLFTLTLVYDVTTGEWHRRSSNNSVTSAHLGNGSYTFCSAVNANALFHYIGDFAGNIYKIDRTVFNENGGAIKVLRQWRAFPTRQEQPMRFGSLELVCQTGIQNTNPTMTLDWSDDGGHNFAPAVTASMGALGATAQRIKFNRLGQTRKNSGLDRIFRFQVSSAAFQHAYTSAELEVEPT